MADRSSRPALKKLPQRYAPFLMPLVLSVFMSAIVSAVATAASVGVGPDFVVSWPSAWGASWIVAFPSLLLLLPVVRRIVAWMVAQP
ncbi:DUF2798 domain-containing protein [Achromobacter xylosoxidans]|uniref:DUF2798 domain-containing protein n=1 Tax=Alcaligenes xylosoxydans xylosoxydans TaxID=85698 RepID=UPI000B496471|nr:DUF2798 domain-containing protein [Achromobacter xylosoxidans]